MIYGARGVRSVIRGVIRVGYDPSSSAGAGIIVQDWIDRVTANGGTVSDTTRAAVLEFVAECAVAGVWDKLVRVNLMCGDWDAALTPLKVGGGFAKELPQGLMDPSDYTELGVQGGVKPYPTQNTAAPTSKWFDTGWVASSVLAAGDCHLGFYNNNISDGVAPSEFRDPLGASLLGVSSTILGIDGNPALGYVARAFAGLGNEWRFGDSLGSGGIRGHLLVSCKSGVLDGLVDGATQGTVISTGVGTPPDSNLFIGATCNASNLSQFATSATLAGYHVGHGLTHAEAVAVSNAMITFQKALGRWVHPAVADYQRRVRQASSAVEDVTWDSALLTVMSDFAVACDTAGLTPKILRANLFAGSTINQARVPLFGGLSYYNQSSTSAANADANQGHTSGDFTVLGGFEKTNPTNSLAIGTAGTIPQLAGGLGVWVKEVPTQGSLFGWADAVAPTERWGIRVNAGTIEGYYGKLVSAVAAAPAPGFFQVIRSSDTDLRLFNNGVEVGDNATVTTPTAVPTQPYTETVNILNTPLEDVDNWVHTCGYSMSQGMTPAEAATYYAIWLTAQTALGRVETYGILTEAGDNLLASNGKQLSTEKA